MSSAMLVDAAPLVYKQYHQIGYLSTRAGEQTGLRYGFTRAVRSYAHKLNTQNVIIAWDTPGPVTKAKGVSAYKANRPRTFEKEEMYNQVPALKELLTLTKWTQVSATGYEADDIIGYITRTLEKQGHQVTIVSSDNDFCQLLSENVTLYVPGKLPQVKDLHYVKANYGVWPNKLLYLRAALGDNSDNLRGLGWPAETRKRFVEFLNKLPTTAMRGEIKSFPEFKDQQDWVTWITNVEIMSLHKPEGLIIQKGKKDPRALEELFQKLEMKSLLKLVPELTGT